MIQKVYVGTGGWYDYKKDSLSPGLRLKAYSKHFDFVEVNSIFYKIPHPKTVERWRQQVPDDFQFTVKCYQALTHRIGIRPVEGAFQTIDTMLRYCRILNARILVLESPASVLLDDKFVKDATEFFNSLSLDDLRIAWELRRRPEDLPQNLIDLMRDSRILHVTDLSREDSRYESDIIYTRIFGNPKNEFRLGPHDLDAIITKIRKSDSRIAYLNTHTPRMVQDAERLGKILGS